MRMIVLLPWKQGLEESRTLTRSFLTAIIAKDGGTAFDRVPMVSSGVDIVVFIVFFVALLAINWGVRIVFVQPIARVILRGPSPIVKLTIHRQELLEKKLETKVQKFSQTAMEQLFYGSFTYFGMNMVLNQPWAWPSKHWWLDFDKKDETGLSIHSYMTEAVAAYYILYAARYFQGMLSVLMEHRRKDFWEMMLHHFVTWALVSISYVHGWNRVGLVIMLVFDPADVPLHTAKMSKYIGERRCPKQASNFYQLCSDGLFVVFMLSFLITRLVIFPYICWSAHIEATRYFPKGNPEWTCVILLYILLTLQVFWGWLLYRVVHKMIRDGHVEDNRSDNDDDDEEGGDEVDIRPLNWIKKKAV